MEIWVIIVRIVKFILLVIFMLSGMIVQTENYNTLTNSFIIVAFILLLSLLLWEKKFNINIYFTQIDILYYLFIFVGMASAAIIGDGGNFFAVLKMLIYYLVLVVFPRNSKNFMLHFNAFFSAGTITFLIDMIDNRPHSRLLLNAGIFQNPNNYGVFAATITIIAQGLLIKAIVEKQKGRALLYLLASVYSLYITVFTGSRTSFLAILITIIISVLLALGNLIKNKVISLKSLQRGVGISLLTTLLIIFLLNTSFYTILQDNLLSKFNNSNADVSSGRGAIWEFYINNSTLLGTPEGYLDSRIGFTAHNSFINVIGQLGILAGILFTLFWLVAFIKSFEFYIKNLNADLNAFLIFSGITLFITMSMMEVLTNTAAIYLAFLCVGYILNHDKYSFGDSLEKT